VTTRLTRARLLAFVLPLIFAGILLLSPALSTSAALLVMQPGPIDHPLHLVGADFNQDGFDDLAIANFQAGTVTVLINQSSCAGGTSPGKTCKVDPDCPGGGSCLRNGLFLEQKNSPTSVGAATVGQSTGGPLFLAVGDLNPEDVDGDRIINTIDNCPNVYNPVDLNGIQLDTDGNGVGDACQIEPPVDTDGDGVLDYDPVTKVLDNCPLTPNPAPQVVERAAGLDAICGTADDNVFLYGQDTVCGTADDDTPPSRVGAACSRSADLVIVNTSSGGGSTLGLVRVRVNDGAGGLRSRTSLPGSSGAMQAALADFNEDHRLDVVVSNSGTDALLFYPGADDGEMGGVCFGGSSAGRSCVGATQCPGGTCALNKVLLTSGSCSGGITPNVACATNDNCPGGGSCRPTIGPGPATCTGGTNPGKSCTKDLDCPGNGTCRSPAGPEGVAAADFNGDGRPDVAFANRQGRNVGVLMNCGAASFSPAAGSLFPTLEQPLYIFAGSLNGDACADLVVLGQGLLTCRGGSNPGVACSTEQDCLGGGRCRADHGTIQVFMATCPAPTTSCPAGSLIAGQSIDLGAGHAPRGGALADFDGDGHLDLAVADFTGSEVRVYAGSGTGSFSPALTLTGPASPSAVATLNFDPDTGPNVDLAVLGYENNRIDLYRNTSSPGNLSFVPAPETPVSPWKEVSAMALFPADASTGQDVALLNASPPRLDVLSGTGTTFRGLEPEPLAGITSATGMTVADRRQDGLLDVLALDATIGKAIPLISDRAGAQTERPAVAAGAGPVDAAVAPITLHSGDYDQDGVPDKLDNCPTRYNPPGCPANDKVGFPQCFVDIPCKTLADALTGCGNPNAAGQCDNDNNGIGDQCEILDASCENVDSDLDLVPDYDQFASPRTIDNCPWIANSSQSDTDTTCSVSGVACAVDTDCGPSGGTCKGDGVGDACDSSVCDIVAGSGVCSNGPKLNSVCVSDADCEAPVNDAVTVDQTGGALSFLIGDASGGMRQAPGSWSAISGLGSPVADVIDRFSYACSSDGFGVKTCNSDPRPDIVVAEKGAPGSGDDALRLFFGDGAGGFAPPSSPVPAQIPLQGDPTDLIVAPNQSVCPNPWLLRTDPRYHFDEDGKTSIVAVVEPGTSSLAVYLASNEGPAPPPGNPNPLPLQSPPVAAEFVDLNQDGYLDLVSLSSGDGNPATPNVTVHIGVGNGLFFTDPSINPTDVPDGMTFLAAGNVNLNVDSTYPDLVLFDSVDQAPVVMTNVLIERADIDRSGRVDGYDLALLARAFGAERGEDFTIEPDGTLLQNPDLTSSPSYDPTRVVVGSGVLKEGMDLPLTTGSASGIFLCDRALQKVSPQYGLPVDINLDGKVDGTDLAIIASMFSRSF